jgi:hypothetical protein
LKADPTAEYDGISIFLRFSNIDAAPSGYGNERKAIEHARRGQSDKGQTPVHPGSIEGGNVTYSTDPIRWKFLDLLPLAKSMTALEIGVGLGQHSLEIQLETLELRLVNTNRGPKSLGRSGADDIAISRYDQ